MKTLYFGLDPSRYQSSDEVTHFPLISTRPFSYENVKAFFGVAHSHVLFTSRTAVTYYFDYTDVRDKVYLCVGEATAARLADFGVKATHTAEEACGEGVITLLKQLDCDHILYPHSAQARRLLPDYLKGKGTAFALYDTFANTKTLPDLSQFDRFVFTSPSTVEVFRSLCAALPHRDKCEAIGPVTLNALNILFESANLQPNNL